MGREIRMVPAHWEHPRESKYNIILRKEETRYKPLFESSFEEAAKEWKQGYADWIQGKYPDYCSEENKQLEYWEWNGPPPEREAYADYKGQPCTWYQVYETVSEGTPITPPFATKDELIDYLVNIGDFWDNKWPRKAAEKFVNETQWAPSFVGTITSTGTELKPGYLS